MQQNYDCAECGIEAESDNSNGMKCPKCGNDMRWLTGLGIPKGDGAEYYNMQIGPGPSKEAQIEFLNAHPGEEINPRGAVKVRNYQHQKRLLKKLGMCEL